MTLILQVVEGIQAVQDTMPSSWMDEPHEKILWGLLSIIVTYIGKQVFDRRQYKKALGEAVDGMSNPHPHPKLNNGRTNSAELLKYVIEDMREIRKDVSVLSAKLEGVRTEVKDLREKL